MDWFLYDRNLRHERIKIIWIWSRDKRSRMSTYPVCFLYNINPNSSDGRLLSWLTYCEVCLSTNTLLFSMYNTETE